MAGRYYVWFLEKGLSEAKRIEHLEDVQSSIRDSTWRCLYTIAVDFRLWPEGRKHPSLFKSFQGGWYGTIQPNWHHYGEISGKTSFLYEDQGIAYLRFFEHSTKTMLDIPIHAIVSSCSAGFPKVAYSVDQYIEGYLGWLDAFENFQLGRHKPLVELQPQLLKENFSSIVFEKVVTINQAFIHQPTVERMTLAKDIQTLLGLMVEEMTILFPQRCKPPYFHVIEWDVDAKKLERKHTLVAHYLQLRKTFPNIVPGRAFIIVK
jgi:hypothetical protein